MKFIFLLGASLLLICGLVANEARKEIFYLCGNFAPRVTLTSVLKQLDTATLSDYVMRHLSQEFRVVHSSNWHLGSIKCTVRIDSAHKVILAVYQTPMNVFK